MSGEWKVGFGRENEEQQRLLRPTSMFDDEVVVTAEFGSARLSCEVLCYGTRSQSLASSWL